MSFPDYFPENFEAEILPKDAEYDSLEVFRILINGRLDTQAFESTYKGVLDGSVKRKVDLSDSGTYSTSCFYDREDVDYLLEMTFKKNHPAAKIAKGVTEASCGPHQITKKRDPSVTTSHVDWWIYKDVEPQNYFKEVQ